MKKLFIIVAVVICFLSAGAIVRQPVAAQQDISVIDQGVENRFPDGLRFYIEAESATAIEEIRVYVRKLGQSSRSVYRVVEFEPGTSISGEAMFRSQTSNEYIPPGTRLSYYFDIRTQDGARLETEPDVIVYLNRGLDWDSVSSGLINVYYYRYNDQSEERAKRVLSVVADTYAFMRPALGVEITEPMNIVVYSNYADMQDAQPPKSQVAQQQLRTLGQAFTTERTLTVDGSTDIFIGDNILTTAAHEFTHLLVADAAGSAYNQVPAWLNEGLAVYSERSGGTEFNNFVAAAIRNDQVPPLASLRTYSGTPRETLRNYGLGHAVVSYMIDSYGEAKMSELFAALRTSHGFEKAVGDAYGLTVPELDNQWRKSVGLAPLDLATPPLPPLQVLPTRRPTPTSAPPPAQTDAVAAAPPTVVPPAATPAGQVEPTYTPRPSPTDVPEPTSTASAPPASPGGCAAPVTASGAGKGRAEIASTALLGAPAALIAWAAVRRRRD